MPQTRFQRLTEFYSAKNYPSTLRWIVIKDVEAVKGIVVLTNNTHLAPAMIAELYRCRWPMELFFKWIKPRLRIKAFFGTSENSVKTQIWIAVAT